MIFGHLHLQIPMEAAVCISELDQLQDCSQAHGPWPHSAASPSQIAPGPVIIQHKLNTMKRKSSICMLKTRGWRQKVRRWRQKVRRWNGSVEGWGSATGMKRRKWVWGKLCSKTWAWGIYSTHRTATERENLGIWTRDSLYNEEGCSKACT